MVGSGGRDKGGERRRKGEGDISADLDSHRKKGYS